MRMEAGRFLPLVKYLLLASLICLGLYYMLRVPVMFNPGVVNNTSAGNATKRASAGNATKRASAGGYIPARGHLTRLGSQLQFDYEMCPRYSLMVNKSAKRVSLHNDCPKVYIIGARKGGTTSLIKYLSKHPNFTAANVNSSYHSGETGYFSRFYDRSWAYYKAQFVSDGEVLGDSSVNNLVNCHVPARMYESCGESMKSMKFIVLLRNPVERFQSNFRFRVFNGFADKHLNMSYFVDREIDRYYERLLKRGLDQKGLENHLNELLCLFSPAVNTIFEGLYLFHLHYWLCSVPAENVLILNSEEFFSQTAEIFSEVIDFIGLSPLSNQTTQSIISMKYNADPALELEDPKNLLSKTEYLRIQEIYQPFNAKLFELLKWPDNIWS